MPDPEPPIRIADTHEQPTTTPSRPTAAPHPTITRTAVLAVHGMGQQLQFDALETVAAGLRTAAMRAGDRVSALVAGSATAGPERLQRLEMDVASGDTRHVVHVYECYWAPITEGQVTIRDVLVFLFRAGFDGLWHAWFGGFRRYIGGTLVQFPSPIRTPLYLLAALFVTVSLLVVNTGVAAAVILAVLRVVGIGRVAWSRYFQRDLTSILNVFAVSSLIFAAVLFAASVIRDRAVDRASPGEETTTPALSVAFGRVSVAAFVAVMVALIVAAAATLLAFYFDITHRETPLVERALGPAAEHLLHDVLTRILLTITTVAVVGVGVVLGFRVVRTWAARLVAPRAREHAVDIRTLAIAIGAAVAAALAIAPLFRAALGPFSGPVAGWRLPPIAWPLALAASEITRYFLIQYVGDTAAYIQPQYLDRFNEIRWRIKSCVYKAARAVYTSSEQYDAVVVVAHSLGSVIAYDVLNQLLCEEQLGTVSGVARRTPLLLTYGSPLDKTAFIFSIQGTGRLGREALATSVQPLLAFPNARPRWINVWSPWDVVSGSLDFYDRPDDVAARRPFCVDNRVDPLACVWLLAHVQYVSGRLLFRILRDAIVGPAAPGRPN
jgi:hypothetical protein